MTNIIKEAALKHGYINAAPATGHPFDLWHTRVQGTYAEELANYYDPVSVTGWPLEEITLWVAIYPTLPVTWPQGCGEISASYMDQPAKKSRPAAWASEIEAMGYEVKRDAFLPMRTAAIRAGLGVHALNGMFIAPKHGSYVYISALPVRTPPPVEARGPQHDISPGCGNCGLCISACPTGAISKNGINAHMCLRRHMGSLETMPHETYPKMGARIYGCDACQQVCPHNAKLKHTEPLTDIINSMKLEELLTNPILGDLLQSNQLSDSYVKTQAVIAAANTGRTDLLPFIEALTTNEDATIRKTAQWAASCLRNMNPIM